LLEQRAPQTHFGGAEPLGNSRQVPDRIHRDLDDRYAAVLVHDRAVALEPPRCQGVLHLVKVEARFGDGDGRARIQSFRDVGSKGFGDEMSPGIERYDALRIAPLGERADARGGMGVGEVGPPYRIERARRDRERTIDSIGAAVAADDIAVARPRDSADDRSALPRVGCAPVDRQMVLCARIRMRGQPNMVGAIGTGHCGALNIAEP